MLTLTPELHPVITQLQAASQHDDECQASGASECEMWGDTLEIKFIKVPPLRILHSSGELDISAKKGLEK